MATPAEIIVDLNSSSDEEDGRSPGRAGNRSAYSMPPPGSVSPGVTPTLPGLARRRTLQAMGRALTVGSAVNAFSAPAAARARDAAASTTQPTGVTGLNGTADAGAPAGVLVPEPFAVAGPPIPTAAVVRDPAVSSPGATRVRVPPLARLRQAGSTSNVTSTAPRGTGSLVRTATAPQIIQPDLNLDSPSEDESEVRVDTSPARPKPKAVTKPHENGFAPRFVPSISVSRPVSYTNGNGAAAEASSSTATQPESVSPRIVRVTDPPSPTPTSMVIGSSFSSPAQQTILQPASPRPTAAAAPPASPQPAVEFVAPVSYQPAAAAPPASPRPRSPTRHAATLQELKAAVAEDVSQALAITEHVTTTAVVQPPPQVDTTAAAPADQPAVVVVEEATVLPPLPVQRVQSSSSDTSTGAAAAAGAPVPRQSLRGGPDTLHTAQALFGLDTSAYPGMPFEDADTATQTPARVVVDAATVVASVEETKNTRADSDHEDYDVEESKLTTVVTGDELGLATTTVPVSPPETAAPEHVEEEEVKADAVAGARDMFTGPIPGSPADAALAAAITLPRKRHRPRALQVLQDGKEAVAKKQEERKKGREIDEQHALYHLSYGMMLGIRTCVGINHERADLVLDDFMAVRKWEFPPDGSSTTPQHKLQHSFKFKDYCPKVFRHLRERFGIDDGDYMMSLCGRYNFIEFISNAKSGQFFFYSHDCRFMIKTQTKNESKFLRRIMAHYYQYVMKNPNTFIVRFYGMHRVKMHHLNRKLHFVIMQSVFAGEQEIHETYDLKGSLQGRAASAKDKAKGELKCVYKDLDLLERTRKLKFGPERKREVLEQLKRDSEFLAKLGIMDYSLLLGIHYQSRADQEGLRRRSVHTALNAQPDESWSPASLVETPPDEVGSPIRLNPKGSRVHLVGLPPNVVPPSSVKARARKKLYEEFLEASNLQIPSVNMDGTPGDEVYHMGIIDILQQYDVKKTVETAFKSLRYYGEEISSVPPERYARRFLQFIADNAE